MTRFIVLALVVIGLGFSACDQPVDQAAITASASRADSLLKLLNSPELKVLNQKLVADPNDPKLYNERALLYIQLKQFTEAGNDAKRAIAIDSTKVDYYITLADAYFAENKTRLSKQTLELILKKFPDNTEGLLKMAELLYLVKQYQPAIDHINKALAMDKNLAKGYYLKGTIYRETGDTARAISSMQTAIEQDNQYYLAYLDLGILYASRKNPLAFEYYTNAQRIQPNSEEVFYARARLLQDLHQLEEAAAAYETIIKKNPKAKNAYYNLGAISLEKRNLKKATDYFSQAIAIDPQYTDAYFARGVCYEELGDKDNAKADYSMCLQLSSNYEPAIDALNNLK